MKTNTWLKLSIPCAVSLFAAHFAFAEPKPATPAFVVAPAAEAVKANYKTNLVDRKKVSFDRRIQNRCAENWESLILHFSPDGSYFTEPLEVTDRTGHPKQMLIEGDADGYGNAFKIDDGNKIEKYKVKLTVLQGSKADLGDKTVRLETFRRQTDMLVCSTDLHLNKKA